MHTLELYLVCEVGVEGDEAGGGVVNPAGLARLHRVDVDTVILLQELPQRGGVPPQVVRAVHIP